MFDENEEGNKSDIEVVEENRKIFLPALWLKQALLARIRREIGDHPERLCNRRLYTS